MEFSCSDEAAHIRLKIKSQRPTFLGRNHGNGRNWKLKLKSAGCLFIPTVEMRLTSEEIRVCCYVFSYLKDKSEVVFRVGNSVGSRGDFLGLCPGRVVNAKVVELMATLQTMNRATNDTTGMWCLPPAFASDVAHGHSAVELFDKYSEDWFRPYEKLTSIYVPICDDSGHWFLSVISFETQLIFHMDTFITYDTINQRRDIIRAVAEMLAEITKFLYTDDQVDQGFFSFNDWNIVEARNTPKCGNSDTAAVCIMEWMGMGTTFLPNVSLVVNDEVLRMRLALRLLLGKNNLSREDLITHANAYWKTLSKPVGRNHGNGRNWKLKLKYPSKRKEEPIPYEEKCYVTDGSRSNFQKGWLFNLCCRR